jgi:hypothetical protein
MIRRPFACAAQVWRRSELAHLSIEIDSAKREVVGGKSLSASQIQV